MSTENNLTWANDGKHLAFHLAQLERFFSSNYSKFNYHTDKSKHPITGGRVSSHIHLAWWE